MSEREGRGEPGSEVAVGRGSIHLTEAGAAHLGSEVYRAHGIALGPLARSAARLGPAAAISSSFLLLLQPAASPGSLGLPSPLNHLGAESFGPLSGPFIFSALRASKAVQTTG